MTKEISLLALVGIVVFTTACAPADFVAQTNLTEERLDTFVKGTTTKNTVLSALGSPQEERREGRRQVLVYKYQHMAPGMPDETYKAVLVFSENNILEEILKTGETE